MRHPSAMDTGPLIALFSSFAPFASCTLPTSWLLESISPSMFL